MLDSSSLPNKGAFDYDDIPVSRCSRIRSSASRPGKRHGLIWVVNRKLGNGNHPLSRRWHNPRIDWRNPFRLGAGRSRHPGYLDQAKRPAPSTMYGTTLRIFDPGIGGWHIIWSDPLNQDYSRQIGRAEGKDIVQIGDDSRGLKARWRFTEITADSFHWIGEERSSNSDPWQITYEHFARRTDPCFGAVLIEIGSSAFPLNDGPSVLPERPT